MMLSLQICLGGTVPEKYYRKNMLSENNDMSKFKTATVQKGSTLQLDYPITVAKSLLRWTIILTYTHFSANFAIPLFFFP